MDGDERRDGAELALYRRGGGIAGVAIGYIDLDEDRFAPCVRYLADGVLAAVCVDVQDGVRRPLLRVPKRNRLSDAGAAACYDRDMSL